MAYDWHVMTLLLLAKKERLACEHELQQKMSLRRMSLINRKVIPFKKSVSNRGHIQKEACFWRDTFLFSTLQRRADWPGSGEAI